MRDYANFNLRKIILGVRMHFRHIFPGQDKAVPSFGDAVEEWKPPDKIYTIDNTINTILCYVLGFFFLSFSFFFFFLIFPPSTALFLRFNPSSFLIIFFSSFSLFFFSYLFSYYFLIFSHHHKTQKAMIILIQLIQCTCVHQATEVNTT